jgi:hypothetical protein
VPSARDDWRAAIARRLADAPAELRTLASDQLHIGGHTNVRLEHPVLDLREVEDDALATRALDFFVVAALLAGATVARVHVRRGVQTTLLPERARRALRGALRRVDDESVTLLRYFDAYLKPLDDVSVASGRRLLAVVEQALDGAPPAAW